MNEMSTYAVMLDIVPYVQFVIMLTELKRMLSQQSETESVCEAQLPQSHQNEPYQVTMDARLLHFYCIINKKDIAHNCMYTVQKCIYTVYA